MKKIMIAACMLFSVASTYAMNTAKAPDATTTAQDNKTKVDVASLPDAVKATLASDQYKGWTPATAWEVKADPVYYIVELKMGDKTTTLNIDKDGKVK